MFDTSFFTERLLLLLRYADSALQVRLCWYTLSASGMNGWRTINGLFGASGAYNTAVSLEVCKGLPVHAAWVRGEARVSGGIEELFA